jgi:PKD repeat protein
VAFVIHATGLTITADGSATTSSLPATIYVWSFGDGTFGTGPIVNHTYANPGSYIVTLTVYALDAKGNICDCKGECRTEIYVDPGKEGDFTCGIGKNAEKSTSSIVLKASPNPFKDNIVVSFTIANTGKVNIDQSDYNLSLVTNTGTVLQSRKLPNLQSTVSLDSKTYASGIYFIVLKNSKGEVQSMSVVKL